MERMRLFVGLPLPEAARQELEGLTTALKMRMRSSCAWTRPDLWHITLRFLGDTPGSRLDAIKEALSRVRFKAFAFRPGQARLLVSRARPRVFWLGAAQGQAPCADLAAQIQPLLAPLGYAPEARPFTAHITLARIKSAHPDEDWQDLTAQATAWNWTTTRLERFVLWRSFPGGDRKTSGASPAKTLHVPLEEYHALTSDGAG